MPENLLEALLKNKRPFGLHAIVKDDTINQFLYLLSITKHWFRTESMLLNVSLHKMGKQGRRYLDGWSTDHHQKDRCIPWKFSHRRDRLIMVTYITRETVAVPFFPQCLNNGVRDWLSTFVTFWAEPVSMAVNAPCVSVLFDVWRSLLERL